MEEKNITQTDTVEALGANEAELALPPKSSEQSSEENSKYAAARRRAQAQRDQAIEQIKRETQEELTRQLDAIFEDCGLIDPYTGSPITSKAQFESYKERHREQSAHPTATEADTTASLIEAEIEAISSLDGDIESMADIEAQPYASRLYELVERGYGVLDAYKLASMDKLMDKSARRALESARASAFAKSHLRKTASAGAWSSNVPKEIRQAYLAFNPGVTDAQISAHYNKYLRE